MKFFNTEGPVKPEIHYSLPPLARLDRGELLELIAREKYFILHAPRQTGKTTCMLALVRELNETGRYRAVYANVEAAQAMRENVGLAMQVILSQIVDRAFETLNDSMPRNRMSDLLAQRGNEALAALLAEWSAADARPLVIVIDEIDALIGDTLISVLRQLRSGYDKRPGHFPQSVILCGVRDIHDYRIHSSTTKEVITGGSAFNIKAKSLRLGDFSPDDVRNLYKQHTAETGQSFDEAVFPMVWEITRGQPWLVNALAYETCFEMKEGKDRSRPITADLIERAKENLILRRVTHLNQLADKLQEERVRHVIQPILAGDDEIESVPPDDIDYVRDLGLIRTEPQIEIANGIYREVIPRQLTYSAQRTIARETAWFVDAGGRLMMEKLLAEFQQFYRENADAWQERFDYKEVGPQLLLQAFLQRIMNGGGDVRREYGLGRKRIDLFLRWPYPGGTQRIVIETKVWRGEKTLREGLEQTARYADQCGAEESHLVLFDRGTSKSWEEKTYHRIENLPNRVVHVWGM